MPDSQPEKTDDRPWYALRLFTMKQMAVADALKAHGLEVFIPQEYVNVEDRQHHIKRMLRPVVRNLLFIKKTISDKELGTILAAMPYKMAVVRKVRDDRAYYEIPACQMFEFQAMCNPDILIKKYLSEEQAKLKKGTPVVVTHGPLKGLTGKLVRANKNYFLLKEVPGIAVMLKVTKWCCKAL